MSRFARLIRKANWYPPFIGMGIRIRETSDNLSRFVVELRPRWYTRNLFGTHFGGSLYTMCDPFYVFALTANLGDGYIVWDKSAAIEFLKPAKGTITGVFEVPEERLAGIAAEVDRLGRQTFHFEADLRNEQGDTVARVRKEVYVRAKSAKRSPSRDD